MLQCAKARGNIGQTFGKVFIQPEFKQHQTHRLDPASCSGLTHRTCLQPQEPTGASLRPACTHLPWGRTSRRNPRQLFFCCFLRPQTHFDPAKVLLHFGLVPKPTYIHRKTCLASLSSFPLPALWYVQKAQEDGLPHDDPSVRPFFV